MTVVYQAKELKKVINQAKKCTSEQSREYLSRIYFFIGAKGETKITCCNGYMYETFFIFGRHVSGESMEFSIPAKFSIPFGAKQVVIENLPDMDSVSFYYPDLGYANTFKVGIGDVDKINKIEADVTPTTEVDFSVFLGTEGVEMALQASSMVGAERLPVIKIVFYKDSPVVTFESADGGKNKVFLLKRRE